MAPAQIIVKQMNGVESWDLWLHHNGPAGHSPLTSSAEELFVHPRGDIPTPLEKQQLGS